MTRRERLMATLRGETVDRSPVSFYEISGVDQTPDNPDLFNIYSHPSWRPLLQLAREKTDLILMRGVGFQPLSPDPLAELTREQTVLSDEGSQLTTRTIAVAGHTLVTRSRRDPDVNTVWTVEPLLKNVQDLKIFLASPAPGPDGPPDVSEITNAEGTLGDSGIVMIDSPDPLCLAASLFSMEEYLVIAMTEQRLFRQLLDRFAATLLPRTEAAAQAAPGHLWRIYGPEYASPPYLPPALFREYVCEYVKPMVASIQRHGGYARIHCHGKLRAILDDIVGMGAVGLDPVEPPPQGDVELDYVRKTYGQKLVLFGNLEASDIENLPTDRFAEKIRRALAEGPDRGGSRFVLMPSACPYGRHLPALALRNYEKMIELAGAG